LVEKYSNRALSPSLSNNANADEPGSDPSDLDPDPLNLWKFIKAAVSAMYNAQESDHNQSGDKFRTVYIDTLDVHTVDFGRVNDQHVQLSLLHQGQEGVKRYMQQKLEDPEWKNFHRKTIRLDEKLTQILRKYETKSAAINIRKNSVLQNFRISSHCPELVLEIFSTDVSVQELLSIFAALQIPLYAQDTKTGDTAFHLAARNDEWKVLEKLLTALAGGLTRKNNSHKTPYDVATTAVRSRLKDKFPWLSST